MCVIKLVAKNWSKIFNFLKLEQLRCCFLYLPSLSNINIITKWFRLCDFHWMDRLLLLLLLLQLLILFNICSLFNIFTLHNFQKLWKANNSLWININFLHHLSHDIPWDLSSLSSKKILQIISIEIILFPSKLLK